MKRTSRTLTVRVDPEAVSMAASIRATAEAAPLLVVTGRALADLADELGSYDDAARALAAIATEIGHPIAVNVPTGDDGSSTVFVSPRGWSSERAQGWAAGHYQELEAQFGPVSHVERMERAGPNRAERRRHRREN